MNKLSKSSCPNISLSLTVICQNTITVCDHKMEEVPEDNGFEEDEEDEVDIDDEFEDIEEEDFQENNVSDSNNTGV